MDCASPNTTDSGNFEVMSINKQVLGMNARNYLYITRYNLPRAKMLADSKLETKKFLIKNDIPTSNILKTFVTRKSLADFSWDLPSDGFVIKPARGYGGEGILVFTKWADSKGVTVSGKTYSIRQVKSHILDIFDGIYSLQGLPDKAFIEERIVPSSFFQKLAPTGLSDIRIIVFNKIPIMAMMRIPTYESGGKANLHLGAIGVGISMRTGITTYAVYKNRAIKFFPNTKDKISGILIPEWDEILLLASRTQFLSGLGFAGVDIVYDKRKGAIVLELNSRPGLSIQIANQASLRERLERVEELDVQTSERGVEIAKSVFSEDFLENAASGKKVLSFIEPITITNDGFSRNYQAKLDTGAYRTSLDGSLIDELGLTLLKTRYMTVSATGREERPSVRVNFTLGGKSIKTVATVAQRSHMRFPVIIGRRDLKGFYVNPSISQEKEEEVSMDNPRHEE